MDLAILGAPANQQPAAIAATVITAPGTTDGLIDVQWIAPVGNDVDEEAGTETGVRWAARASRVPAVGDYALLLIDSRGDPFALVWATGN